MNGTNTPDPDAPDPGGSKPTRAMLMAQLERALGECDRLRADLERAHREYHTRTSLRQAKMNQLLDRVIDAARSAQEVTNNRDVLLHVLSEYWRMVNAMYADDVSQEARHQFHEYHVYVRQLLDHIAGLIAKNQEPK